MLALHCKRIRAKSDKKVFLVSEDCMFSNGKKNLV